MMGAIHEAKKRELTVYVDWSKDPSEWFLGTIIGSALQVKHLCGAGSARDEHSYQKICSVASRLGQLINNIDTAFGYEGLFDRIECRADDDHPMQPITRRVSLGVDYDLDDAACQILPAPGKDHELAAARAQAEFVRKIVIYAKPYPA